MFSYKQLGALIGCNYRRLDDVAARDRGITIIIQSVIGGAVRAFIKKGRVRVYITR